jgi:hypothetical protein
VRLAQELHSKNPIASSSTLFKEYSDVTTLIGPEGTRVPASPVNAAEPPGGIKVTPPRQSPATPPHTF